MARSPESHIMDVLGDGCGEPVYYAYIAFRSDARQDDPVVRERAGRFVLGLAKRGDVRVYREEGDQKTEVTARSLEELLKQEWPWQIGTARAEALIMEASPDALRRWGSGDVS